MDESSSNRLLADGVLEQSGVVANCRMNRERVLTGSNGYSTDLGFNPLDLLRKKAVANGTASWLDLCCGSGRALIDAAQAVQASEFAGKFEIVGIDLVGMFAKPAMNLTSLELIEASLTNWHPNRQFDVITCVHGLHYIGDKLGLISRVGSWLTMNGRFTANLSLENIRLRNVETATRIVATEMRKHGLTYDNRKNRVTCKGCRQTHLPFQYLGADDQAGPNYTGQAVVDSYYEWRG